MKKIQAIACALAAQKNCLQSGNLEWRDRWGNELHKLTLALPSGSGFDCGTTIMRPESTDRRVVLETSFHHMDDAGGYDGWTAHLVVVTPSFDGFDLRVTGRNRNDIKEYIADVFYGALGQPWVWGFGSPKEREYAENIGD